MILGTLSEQTSISLPQGCCMLNTNAFLLVVHGKKIFDDLPTFPYSAPYWAPKRPSPFIWTNL